MKFKTDNSLSANTVDYTRTLLRMSLMAFAVLMAMTASVSAQAQTSSKTEVEIMKSSGFKVDLGSHGGLLFLPNLDGSYKLTARVPKTPKSEWCEKKKKIHRKTGNIMNTVGICIIPNWEAPKDFESTLSNAGMTISDFNDAMSANGSIAILIGVEDVSLDRVRAETFNISDEINEQLRKNEADIWTVCWALEGTSSSAIEPATRADCRGMKSIMMDLEITVAQAELAVAQAENDAATKRLEENLGIRP